MNLFNYLMAKKGHNTSVRDDLLAYLLGKRTPKEVKTATGTTISISDVTRTEIVSLTLSKESSQDSVVYVDVGEWEQGVVNSADGTELSDTNGIRTKNYIRVYPNVLYDIKRTIYTSYMNFRFFDINNNYLGYQENINVESNLTEKRMNSGQNSMTLKILDERVAYMRMNDYSNNLTVTYTISTENTPSPDYPQEVKTVKGNVGITISDGTNTRNYTIPLGNNEICGIGTYKDELIVDKNGKCWLNKKTGKGVLNGSENWKKSSSYKGSYYLPNDNGAISNAIAFSQLLCNNFIRANINNSSQIASNYAQYTTFIENNLGAINFWWSDSSSTLEGWKTWLSANNTIIYYPLATPELIDLNYTVDIKLFNGVNNISNSDDMDMILKYY